MWTHATTRSQSIVSYSYWIALLVGSFCFWMQPLTHFGLWVTSGRGEAVLIRILIFSLLFHTITFERMKITHFKIKPVKRWTCWRCFLAVLLRVVTENVVTQSHTHTYTYTYTHTHTQTKYCNPRYTCAPRVNHSTNRCIHLRWPCGKWGHIKTLIATSYGLCTESQYSASLVIQTSLIRIFAYPNFVRGRSDIIKLLTHYTLYAHALALQNMWFCCVNPIAGSSKAVKQQHGSLRVHKKVKASCFLSCTSDIHLSEPSSAPRGSDNRGCTVEYYPTSHIGTKPMVVCKHMHTMVNDAVMFSAIVCPSPRCACMFIHTWSCLTSAMRNLQHGGTSAHTPCNSAQANVLRLRYSLATKHELSIIGSLSSVWFVYMMDPVFSSSRSLPEASVTN